jgi:hypothetical protein
MQRIGAQEVPLLPQNTSSRGGGGGSSSSFPALQSISRLQQNVELWSGVSRLQRKVFGCCRVSFTDIIAVLFLQVV